MELRIRAPRGDRPGARAPRPFGLALGLALLACPLALLAQAPADRAPRAAFDNPLPALGDVSSQTLSPAAERRLGDRIMRSVLRDPAVVDDPLIQEYVADLWASLLASARQRGDIGTDLDELYAWRPFLVRERSVNAFALPGGYIGVHLGLLAVTASPDELASVLAHELSHVTQRHIARMMSQSRQQSWVGLAAMVLGALAASRSPQAASAMIMGGQGIAAQGQLNFSRDMEREADRVGFGVMTQAGFAGAGMAQMFEQLQLASRLTDDNSYPYLRSHPLTSERIGEARARMGTQGWGVLGNAPAVAAAMERVRVRHALMAARSKVLMDTRSVALQGLLRPVEPPSGSLAQVAHHYTTVVAATQLRDRDLAEQALGQARKAAAGLPPEGAAEVRRVLLLADAELAVQTSRAGQAVQMLGGPLGAGLGGAKVRARPEVMLQARAALNLPEARDAQAALLEVVNLLQPHVAAFPDDTQAWTYLSGAWSRLGQPLRAVRAEAEASAASGDVSGAIDRVEAARRRVARPSAAELVELSVMDARVARWRQTLREDSRDELDGR